MKKRLMLVVVAVLAVACGSRSESAAAATAAAAPQAAVARPSSQVSWPQFVDGFVESYFRAQPFFAVGEGRHEFDGQMPDWSARGLAAEAARLRKQRDTALAFDAAALTPAERFEREYLLTVIDSDLFWLERARFPFRNPAWYIGQLDPDVYLNRKYAPLARRVAGYIGYLRSIPGLAADIRANLSSPLPPTFIERGIGGFGGFAEFFRKDAPAVLASVHDPAAQKQLSEATAAAAAAMEGLKAWLESERGHATGSFALGEPLFLEMLHTTEHVDVPLGPVNTTNVVLPR